MRPPQSLCLCFSLQALCYLCLEVFKSWPRRTASSFAQYNTGCVVPYFLYAYESVFPVNLPKLFTHQWKILLPMQAGPDVTTRAANHTISALFARSFAQVPGRQPPAAVSANSTILLQSVDQAGSERTEAGESALPAEESSSAGTGRAQTL